MQRKIFIGIDLPQSTKTYLERKIEKWRDLPIRWTRPQNLHITLIFIGYIEDEQSMEICQKVETACQNVPIFEILLHTVELGPDLHNPKMLWVTGELSQELKELQESIEKALGIFVREKKAFRPHVTLGKIRQQKWQELPDSPSIIEKVNIPLTVESITVFESTQEHGPREYLSLEHCPLH